jgi:branched-chain amino acid transport system substrate-binding protein
MIRTRRHFNRGLISVPLGAALLSLPIMASPALAADAIKIGVMGDLSGYSAEIGGPGAVLAVKMAVEDHKNTAAKMPVEVVQADFLNKPDVATQIARRWFDVENVDAITDLPNTPTALAIARLGKETNHIILVAEAATPELTNAQCSPTTMHMADDTNALAAGTAKALIDKGLKNWFFLTADFGFGIQMQASAEKVVRDNGGTVVGSVRHPLGASDFSSFLLQAQASKAQVIALANVGDDTTNAIKQANEFGIKAGGQVIAGLLMVLSDIKALGLPVAKDLYVTESFYWDNNDASREFAKRFAARDNGKYPTKAHAANYIATKHYLDAIDAAGTKEPKAVMAKMRELPIDYFGRPAKMRDDGRVVYDLDLFQVKSPEESKGPYDFYKPVRHIDGAQSFAPLNPSTCAMLQAGK